MIYYLHFRIKYQDPFGNSAYYHDMAVSDKPVKKGGKFLVQDTQTGFVSPYEAECHCNGGIARITPGNTRRFRVYEGIQNAV